MASEYNSKLISDLYDSTKSDKAHEVADIMGEIGDPIFLYPLYDAYKRYQKRSISHYFPANICDFAEAEALPLLLKIFRDKDATRSDKLFSLPGIAAHKCFERDIIDEVIKILTELSSSEGDDIDFGFIISYLKAANSLKDVDQLLRTCFENPKTNRRGRKIAFEAWLKIDPEKSFDYLLNNYSAIKEDMELEIVITKEISTWTGTKVEAFKALILEKGGSRAKEIIEESEKKKKREAKEKEAEITKTEDEKFKNSKVVYDILEIKDRINILSLAIPEIGIEIFSGDTKLPKQIKSANDEGGFCKSCIDLRVSLASIDEKTGDHGLTEDQIKVVLPNAQEHDRSKPINRLNLFLVSKKIIVDQDFFGLRDLSRVVSLIAHPDGVKDAIVILKKLKLFELYQAGEWAKLHNALLSLYLDSLVKLETAIKTIQIA